MIFNITCPNCNFSRKVPQEKIPEGIKYAKCPRCGNTFELPSVSDQNTASEEDEDKDFYSDISTGSGPDTLDDVGYFAGLWRTLRGVLFSPAAFFSGLRREGGIGDSFAFGILMGSIGTMFGIFWQFLLDPEDITYIARLLPESVSNNHIFLGLIIISPVLVLINVFIVSAVLHFFLLILGGANNRFEGTLKAVLYSNATSIFYLIPYVGELMAFFWGLVVLIIGLREVHETTTLRALFSLLLPFFIFIILVIAVAVFFALSIF